MGHFPYLHFWWCSSWAGFLDLLQPSSFGFTSNPLLLVWYLCHNHLSIRGWRPICMSEGYYDDEVAEITVRFRGLVVTVSGPPSQASQLVEDLAHLAARRRPSSPARSTGSFSAVTSIPDQSATTSRRGETREEIARSFPDCPHRLLSQATRLGGDLDSARHRLRRAWTAGQWAGAVLSNRVGSPNRTEQIRERPRVYVVLRADGLPAPACFGSSAAYWNCVGSLANSSSISHSFPSETEARIYCEGAGVAYPGL